MHLGKTFRFLLVTLLLSSIFTSCLQINGRSFTNFSFPLGIRAKKKKLQPPYEFADAILQYKKQKGVWPTSETAMIAANKQVGINKLYNSGFLSWEIGLISSDTLVVHFIHEPVYTQTISLIAIAGRKVKLKTVFVASTYSYKTELER